MLHLCVPTYVVAARTDKPQICNGGKLSQGANSFFVSEGTLFWEGLLYEGYFVLNAYLLNPFKLITIWHEIQLIWNVSYDKYTWRRV